MPLSEKLTSTGDTLAIFKYCLPVLLSLTTLAAKRFWSEEFGVRSEEFGVWSEEFGVRSEELGVWSSTAVDRYVSPL